MLGLGNEIKQHNILDQIPGLLMSGQYCRDDCWYSTNKMCRYNDEVLKGKYWNKLNDLVSSGNDITSL